MMPRTAIALALIPLLAACGAGSGGGTVKTAASRPSPAPVKTAVRAPVRRAPGPAQVLAIPGLEGVIGATGAELTRQFGPARLDVIEGDARKLQFAGTACVLDVYLYPAAPGREPTAAYVDTRRASDGQDVDRAACAGALQHRGSPPATVSKPR